VIRTVNTRFILRPCWLIAIFLEAVLCSGQQASEAQKPAESATPTEDTSSSISATFRSRTDLVLVPVAVRDKKGEHVSGLSKEAFQLEENGKGQTISLFEEIHAPVANLLQAVTPDRGYSNLPFDNAGELRLTIMVLDLLNTGPFQRTDGRDQFIKFLSKGLAANQPVSLLCITSKGLRLVHPFSTDTNSLIESLKKTPLGAFTIANRTNVVYGTIAQLREIAQGYAGIPGRKTMILAAGYIPELATERQMIETTEYASDLQRMWKSLMDANIAVYPIQLMEWAADPARGGLHSRPNYIFLRDFADNTGGNRCLEANALMECLTEAVDDSRSYYMLGFSVQPEDRKPGWRDLKVKVSGEHLDVRARNGFYYGVLPAGDSKSVRDDEINALASPLAASGVPMFVKVLPSQASSTPPAAGGKNTVEFLMTIPLSSIKIDGTRSTPLDLEVGAIALTDQGKEAGEFLHPVQGNPKPENVQQWARDGIKLKEKLDLPPGSYDVRFLVRDNNASQIGTVVFPLDVH